MKIHSQSGFKNPESDKVWFENWVTRLADLNQRTYGRIRLQTALGETCVWTLPPDTAGAEALVIFPGARTTSLFWDLDRGLDHLPRPLRIFLVETNGLPNLSDGATPDIRSLDYGVWAAEVLDKLGLKSCFVAGASFGGLICMKLAITHPEKIKAAFLLNPGCLQTFSMSFKNLWHNLLPVFAPSEKNVRRFLDKAVFCKPEHALSAEAENLLVEYEVFALKRYRDKTQKPYFMDGQLKQVKAPVYLLLGNKDLLFPYQKSANNARRLIPDLREVKIFSDVGHGIELYAPALKYAGKILQMNSGVNS